MDQKQEKRTDNKIPIFDNFLAQNYPFKVSNGHFQFSFDVANAKIYNRNDFCKRRKENF